MQDNSWTNILSLVLTLAIPPLVGLSIELLRRQLGTERLREIQEELDTKRELATAAVRFAEQAYQTLDGPQKFQKASEWLSREAQKYGLKLSPEEIKGLIESSLRMLKDQFADQWSKKIA